MISFSAAVVCGKGGALAIEGEAPVVKAVPIPAMA